MILAGPLAVCAGNFQVRSWYKDNGLPDNVITALAQTRDGYLWIGTPAGLVRFDGEHIKSVVAAGFTSSLEDSNVVALAVDSGGHLWIASASGLITELAAGKFNVRYRPPEATDAYKIAGGSVIIRNWHGLNSIFARDESGRVCALTIAEEVVRFNDQGQPEKIPMEGLPPGIITGLASDPAGQLWLLKGTNAVALENGRWSVCASGPINYQGKILCPAMDRGFWTARKTPTKAYASLIRKTNEQWTVTTQQLPKDPFDYPVTALLQDHVGRFWLAFSKAGISVMTAGKAWIKVQTQGPLEKCSVRCLYEDKDGGIWVGTEGKGLHQVLDPLIKMTLLPQEAGEEHVTSVSLSRENVWLGTDRGLYTQNKEAPEPASMVESLGRQNIYAVLEDSHSNVWVGAKSGIFLRTNEVFEKVLTATNGGFLALFEDRAGNVWAGGFHNALYRFHDGTNDFICRPPKKRNLAICCLAEDTRGTIWVLTRTSGLWQVDQKRLVAVEAVGPEINGDTIATGLFCDASNGVWISILGNGLFRWDGTKLRQFTVDDGLLDNGILGVAGDDHGNLWMSSRNGIFSCSLRQLNGYDRLTTAPLVCQSLGVDEGMADRECTGAGQPVIARDADGCYAVATTAGAAKFTPAAVSKSAPIPECFIETLNVDGRISAETSLSVPSDARHFEFQYAAPELAAPQKLHFRYRLDGVEQAWTEAGKERTAVYNRLPPGQYHFRVMVGGGDGYWREANRQILLQVVPFFWQTWWFQALLIMAAILLISGSVALHFRRRARRSLERLEAQRAVEQVRQRITRDLHDELGSAITEIIQISDLTLEPDPAAEILRAKMASITDRVRRLSITVDEIVWTMSSRNDTLRSLVGYMSNHAQEFFRYSNIRCRLDISTTMPEVVVDSQKRHNLYLAMKEALNNAAKHSGATEVILRAHFAPPVLRISVEDNGRGFAPGTGRSGEGLTNMRERLEVLGGQTVFASPPGGGTVVVFTLNLESSAQNQSTPPPRNISDKNRPPTCI